MKHATIWTAAAAFAACLAAAGDGQARGFAQGGHEIATRWCAACHVVDAEQTRGSPAVPTFMEIASRGDGDLGWIEGFLADPHPEMPDMSLTRQEIRDLVAYVESLR